MSFYYFTRILYAKLHFLHHMNFEFIPLQVNSLQLEQKKLQGKIKSLESQLSLDKKISQAKEDCNQIRRSSVMAMGSLASQRFAVDFRSPTLNHKPLSGTSSLRPLSQGSALGSDMFLNGTNKRKISETTESSSSDIRNDTNKERVANVTDSRVDSRSVKSRTCIVM